MDAVIDKQIIAAMVKAKPSGSRTAHDLAQLKFSTKQQSEVARLLDKNNAGTITDAELHRLKRYVHLGNQLNLLGLKASLIPDP